MKYTSQENPLGTSPHFDDGTQGELDFVEAKGFVNTTLKSITSI
jgi:hypothetical protein